MKALIFKKYGDPDQIVLADIPEPALKPDEILVRVHAVGLNPVDTMIPKGAFKSILRFQLPATMGSDLAGVESEFASAAALLVDAPTDDFGGSGRTFNWSRLPKQRSKPLVLAGGLNADNVAAAIAEVRPYAVDVSSGVEELPGVKSASKIESFIAAVRRADQRS